MHILVIEDEIGIANFLRDGLQEESFAVDVALDGKKGLSLALENDYDIILLDWMIPAISGIEVLRQLRKNNIVTPVIFLTAKDALSDTIFGLESGANDYIKKPFHFEELLARIRVQLRTSNSETNVLKFGDIELDLDTHQVKRKGDI
ncbi:MAG: response regulator transcription factor, partial [Bacteroidota bacterium]|nr:response regulator transcription factor [Bacteroidota bacterium]